MSNIQSNVPQSNAAPVLDVKAAEQRYAELKKRARRFRVLILGRANAGKTTILKKICNTTDEPEIYNSRGKKIDTSKLEPTSLRGHHDIDDEMVFRSNPTFIFHDSRGFEAGGVDELRKAKAFVSERSRAKDLSGQVHVIWYCIPLDDDRPFANVENIFFSESGTGKVPVIVIFTKCEALQVKAIEALEDQGYDYDEAVEKAPKYADENLKNVHLVLEAKAYPPKGHVYLQELDKPENGCEDLVECTTRALDGNILQGLFISTQQNSLELAMKYSLRSNVEKALAFNEKSISADLRGEMFKGVLRYFPYHWRRVAMVDVNMSTNNNNNNMMMMNRFMMNRARNNNNNRDNTDVNFDDTLTPEVLKCLVQLATNYESYPLHHQLIHYSTVLSLLAEHLSVVWSSKSVSSDDIISTIDFYQESQTCIRVMQAVKQVLVQFNGLIPPPPSSHLDTVLNNLTNILFHISWEHRLDKTDL